ncbi:hypothetical protein F7D29_09875 [Prevotella copri]|uniref:Uncharacterized protein n=1 Tax=Segatella copri TaxID=165179 RepID=A0AAW9TB07_9BACT|nr:hypothetical protein [Segatella copri]MQN30613.1 hypothetical protein [Segatella copri]MQN36321.1 hypothetical protein [Segatella copri]MQN74320.1 hypothetical protein [Segatella copri]MQO27626.1 hypothetical protein [Segatella copri]
MLNVELGIRHSNWQFNIQHSTLNTPPPFNIQHSTFNIITKNEVYILECKWPARLRRQGLREPV